MKTSTIRKHIQSIVTTVQPEAKHHRVWSDKRKKAIARVKFSGVFFTTEETTKIEAIFATDPNYTYKVTQTPNESGCYAYNNGIAISVTAK